MATKPISNPTPDFKPEPGWNTSKMFKALKIVATIESLFVKTFRLLQPDEPLPNVRLITRRIDLGIQELEKQPANSPAQLASQNLRREWNEIDERIKKYLGEEKTIQQSYEKNRPPFFNFLGRVHSFLNEVGSWTRLPETMRAEQQKVIADQREIQKRTTDLQAALPILSKTLDSLEKRLNATAMETGVQKTLKI
jgi:hypothetical protein